MKINRFQFNRNISGRQAAFWDLWWCILPNLYRRVITLVPFAKKKPSQVGCEWWIVSDRNEMWKSHFDAGVGKHAGAVLKSRPWRFPKLTAKWLTQIWFISMDQNKLVTAGSVHVALGSSAVTRVRVAPAHYVSLSRKTVGATRARAHNPTRALPDISVWQAHKIHLFCLECGAKSSGTTSIRSTNHTPAQTRSAERLTADADIFRGEKSIATGRRLGFVSTDLDS